MDSNFILYQLQSEMWNFILLDWQSELATVTYWGVIAFILVYYAIWWKLTDKRRISDLLLFGSLLAVIRFIIDTLGVTAGLWLYKIHILPTSQSVFLHVLTITPLTYMLAQQYSPNWKQFFVWGAVAGAWVSFVILPTLSVLDIYQPMKWNFVYGFFVSYGAAIFARGAFHLIKQVQHKAIEGYDSPLQRTLMHPAYKPIDENDNERDKT